MKRAGRVFVAASMVMLIAAVLWRVGGQGFSVPVDQPKPPPRSPPEATPPPTGLSPRPVAKHVTEAHGPPPGPGPDDGEGEGEGDEARVMTRIRNAVRPDPTEALALIDAANREHPRGPFVEERAALRVDALVYQRRIGPARDAAEEFLSRYPQSARAQHIVMLTGVHPPPPDHQDPSEDPK